MDKRADIWAFGAVLFEMLTGSRPFTGDNVAKTLAHVIAINPDWSLLPADVPPLIGAFLRGCLEKDPTQRVRDIGDVRLVLTGTFDTGVAPPLSPAAAPGVPWWQRPVPLASVAVAIMVVASLTGWSLRPTAPSAVTRFSYDLPADHQLRQTGRPVLAVSRDGRRFAYNTNQGLYLRSMDALEGQLLPGTEGVLENPVFSADGQSLAYTTRPDGQLRRLALSGGAPVVLSEVRQPFAMSWEADGTILLADDEGIMRVSANGGTPELVVAAQEGERLDSPRLMPDGDSILFTVGGSGTGAGGAARDPQIAVQSMTSGVRTVLAPGADASYVSTGHLLVAASLEADWNQTLRARDEIRDRVERERAADRATLDEAAKERIRALAQDFPTVWHNPAVPQRERKRMMALLVTDVTLTKAHDEITLGVRFRGGTTTTLCLPVPLNAWRKRQTHPKALARLDVLLATHTDSEVASTLNAEGWTTGAGAPFDVAAVRWLQHRWKIKSYRDHLRDDGYLTAAEMAGTLGFSARQTRHWRRAGQLLATPYNDRGDHLYRPIERQPPRIQARVSAPEAGVASCRSATPATRGAV